MQKKQCNALEKIQCNAGLKCHARAKKEKIGYTGKKGKMQCKTKITMQGRSQR
jgi:hypothetical protein